MDGVLQTAYGNLIPTQEWYKQDFDTRTWEVSGNIHPGDYVYFDRTDDNSKPQPTTPETAPDSKLRTIAIGPFRVLSNEIRNSLIERDGVIELVSADHMAYAPSPPQPVPSSATPAAFAAEIRTVSTYDVDKLLNCRVADDDSTEFLVTWSANRTLICKPRSHLLEKLVSRCFKRTRRRTGRYPISFVEAGTFS